MDERQARTKARELMDEFGLQDWGFEFDTAIRRAGACHWPALGDVGKITLSRSFVELNDEAHVEDVIRHEIAHALAGHRAKHSQEWRIVAMGVGCKSVASCTPPTAVPVPTRWVGTCPTPGCGCQLFRQEMSARARRLACSKCCGGKFDPKFLFVWVDRKAMSADARWVEEQLR